MTLSRRSALALPLLGLLPAACGARSMILPGDGDYTVERDIAYGEGPRRTLDVYRPAGPPVPRPILFYFYGGLWSVGSKTHLENMAIPVDMVKRGAVVVVPDYRLHPEVNFPAFMEDAGAAVAWAWRNAAGIGGRADGVYLSGHSTGGYMAIQLGLDRRYIDAARAGPLRLAGLIGIAGIYEQGFFEHRIMRPIYGRDIDLRTVLPVRNLRAGLPPMLLLNGSWDATVYPRNARELAEAVRAAGSQAEVKIYPRIGHLDILAAAPFVSSFAGTADDMAEFIRRTLPAA